MNELIICVVISAAVIAVSVATIALNRRRTRRIMDNLNDMLDAATDGRFAEKCFDESLLSAVETKLSHYLDASEVSARNLSEEKDKIKELIGDISHQTKLPISNILLYSQLLGEQELPPQAAEYAAPLSEQAEKLRFLIEALVKTSRLETGVLSLNPQQSQVAELVESAVAQILPSAAKKQLEVECGECDFSACFDPKWTAEALNNLLDNAVKYTPCGGRISISAAQYELFCKITVTDTGIGIPEDEQPKVFTRFYRSPRVSGEPGVGIGLYLTRQIAGAQGGYMKLESSVGKGSSFSLFLPTAV